MQDYLPTEYLIFRTLFSPKECEEIISLWSNPEQAKVVGFSDRPPREIRDCEISWLTRSDQTQWIFGRLETAISDAKNNFRLNPDLIIKEQGLQLTRYRTGGHYYFHKDKSSVNQRVLSLTLQLRHPMLNSGGRFEFLSKDNKLTEISLDQGDLLVFKSELTHRVSPVLLGERWSLVTWYSFS